MNSSQYQLLEYFSFDSGDVAGAGRPWWHWFIAALTKTGEWGRNVGGLAIAQGCPSSPELEHATVNGLKLKTIPMTTRTSIIGEIYACFTTSRTLTCFGFNGGYITRKGSLSSWGLHGDVNEIVFFLPCFAVWYNAFLTFTAVKCQFGYTCSTVNTNAVNVVACRSPNWRLCYKNSYFFCNANIFSLV